MKQYVCGICGYIHDEAVGGKWEDLPADWKCPVCKAGKDAFKPKEEKTASQEVLEKPHVDKELSPMEMSIICSNLPVAAKSSICPSRQMISENWQSSSEARLRLSRRPAQPSCWNLLTKICL